MLASYAPLSSGLIVQDVFQNNLLNSVTGTALTLSGSVSYIPGPYSGTTAINIVNTAGSTASNFVYESISNLTSPYSISFWFNAQSLPSSNSYSTIVGLGTDNNWALRFMIDASDNCFKLQVRNSGNPVWFGSLPVNTNTWYHVVYTITASYDNSLFVNGLLVSSANLTQITQINRYALGTQLSNNQEYAFNGYIDNFYLYNRILTTDEINVLSSYIQQPISGVIVQDLFQNKNLMRLTHCLIFQHQNVYN
jgi:hypothetical protein